MIEQHKNIIFALNNKWRKCYNLCHKLDGIIVGYCYNNRFSSKAYIVVEHEKHFNKGLSASNDREYDYFFFDRNYDVKKKVMCLTTNECRLFDKTQIIDLLNKLEL